MRSRTFILIILILLVAALGVILWFSNQSGNNPFASLNPNGADTTEGDGETDGGTEAAEPAPTATPSVRFEDVVIAKTKLPIGTMLTLDLLEVERRPDTNIVFQGGVHVTDPEELVGEIVKVPVSEGQEILRPMLALNPTDLPPLGSDLALYVDQGRVAIAMPITRYSGAAFAMRPGDAVDILMTLDLVELDETFRTQLPNNTARIIEPNLTEGRPFLLPDQLEGRLEFVEELGIVAEIAPSAVANPSAETQIPRRVTQLTVQQAQVVWVGTWQQERPSAPATTETDALGQVVEAAPTPDPVPQRTEINPDLVILSMTAQEALSLKWALERGIDVDLALRSPGDNNQFVTTSISLPQLVDQGRIFVPEPGTFDVSPRADEVFPPAVPAAPPSP
ncbi:MAG: SAF domain-containing protein [Chloroflexota bacterium]